MGNCNCRNNEMRHEGILFPNQSNSNLNNSNSTKQIEGRKEEKYFKLRKPKANLDSEIKEEKQNSKLTTTVISNNNGTQAKYNSNCKSSHSDTKNNFNQSDIESIDERVVIHNTKGKSNYVPTVSISLEKIKTNKDNRVSKDSDNGNSNGNDNHKSNSALQYTMISQVASYNIDKNDTNMFNSAVYKLNQEEALDPLTKAFSMNNFILPKYEETMIEQRELFSLIDSVSVKNYKEVYEETSSRETYSYLHNEIKKSSFILTLIFKKKHKELRYQFNIWKSLKENKLKNNIIKSLALVKLKTVFSLHYKHNYYKMLIKKLKLFNEGCGKINQSKKTMKSHQYDENHSNGFMNQMITFINVSTIIVIIYLIDCE